MSSQKIILVIVEGASDRDSLQSIFNEMTEYNPGVHFAVTRGDVLQDRNVKQQNVLAKIKEVVEDYTSRYKYNKADILRVVHVVDIDGVFIDDSKIYQVEKETIEYKEDGIYTRVPNLIKARNESKSKLLKFISSKKTIWENIPYSVYYFSCNLEWVLHDSKEYYTKDEKCELAIDFSEKYEDDIDGFINFINSPSFAAQGTYKDTWEYIQNIKDRIERKSNLHLFVNEIIDS